MDALAWKAGTWAGVGFADGTGAGVCLIVDGWVGTTGAAVAKLAETVVAKVALGFETGIGDEIDVFKLG